jgi:class 3 adenylate cyclase
MIRLTYISTISDQVTAKDIRAIGEVSEKNNERDGLTGVLICFRGIFYQIIEGEELPLYSCFERIKKDPRHGDIFILNLEKNIPKRMYTQWRMKTVFLDSETYPLIMPIRNLLNSLAHTQQVLKQYVPAEVLEGVQKGENPSVWAFKREELIVLFSDIIAFTAITEKINLPDMQELLDTYFGIASLAITKSGGKIAKLTGDGFMAYYPAGQAASALHASLEIIRELKKQRETTASPFLQLAYCGIGLSAGWVVMGNVGSDTRQDYTVLGDVVNSASRLESYTREAGHSILFDDRFREYLEKSPSVIPVLGLGEQILKGKSKTLSIFTVDHPDVRFDQTPAEIYQEIGKINL